MTEALREFTPEERGDVFDPSTLPGEVSPVAVQEEPEFASDFLESLVGTPSEEEQEHARRGYVPKGRFNEVNEKAKLASALEIENQALKSALELIQRGAVKPQEEPEVEINPIDQMEDQVTELQLLSETAKLDYGLDSVEYKQALKDYNRANRQLIAMEADTRSNAAVNAFRSENEQISRTRNELQEVAEAAYEVYPFLNQNGEVPNQDAIDKVLTIRDTLIQTGKSAAKALQEAIDLIAPLYPNVSNASEASKVADIRSARDRASREKAAQASASQPVFRQSRSDESGFKLDINKMTPEEVAKLPKDVLDKMSGNAI